MIPKIIHICHKSIHAIEKYARKWIEINPEYELRLYDDDMCKDFLLKEFGQTHVDIFDYIKDGPIKCDFWRVCILFKYGGVYADADIVPFVPLRDYINPTTTFVTCVSNYDGNTNYNPHFIMCEPGNIKIYRCIQWYNIFYSRKNYEYWAWSIIKLFNIIFKNLKNVDDEKTQMLYESNIVNGNIHTFYCAYKGRHVMNCRHDDYDPGAHCYKN